MLGLISIIILACFSVINIIYLKIIFLVMVAMPISGIYALCGAITVRANPKSAGAASGFSIGMGLAPAEFPACYDANSKGRNCIALFDI
jgi:hypothetical protein